MWLAAWTCAALAGTPIAVVISDDIPAYEEPVDAFLAEKDGLATVYRLHGREAESALVSARLTADPPQVVFAVGAKAAWTARRALPQVPIVYAAVRDPARYGVAGPMVTGVTMAVPPETTLSQFVAFFPDAKRIGVVAGPALGADAEATLVAAAGDVGVTLEILRVADGGEVRGELHRARDIDALWLLPEVDLLTANVFRTIQEEARRRQLPVMVDTPTLVRAGATFAVVPDPVSVGRQAAGMVQVILDGAYPSDIEPEAPVGRKVALNRRALEQAGLVFDPLLADFVDILIQ